MPEKPASPKNDSATPERPVLHSRDEFRAWLRRQCDASSVKAVAANAGISPPFLSAILAGRSSIGDSLVARFHYGRRVIEEFYPLDPPAKPAKK